MDHEGALHGYGNSLKRRNRYDEENRRDPAVDRMHSHRFGNAGFSLADCDTETGNARNRYDFLCIHDNRHRKIENSRGERGMWVEPEQGYQIKTSS